MAAPAASGVDEMLELEYSIRRGRRLWKWVIPRHRGAAVPRHATPKASESRQRGSSRALTGWRFDAATGQLAALEVDGRAMPLRGPVLAAWRRVAGARNFEQSPARTALRSLQLAPAHEPGVLARAQYDGALREVTWLGRGDELVVRYRIDFEGAADILGLTFAYPGKRSHRQTLGGCGPVSHLEEPPGRHGIRPARDSVLPLDPGRELPVPGVRGLLRRMALARNADPRRELRHPQQRERAVLRAVSPIARSTSRSSTCPTWAGRSCTRCRPSAPSSRCPTCSVPSPRAPHSHGALQGELIFRIAPRR